jgi:hypothetical protein
MNAYEDICGMSTLGALNLGGVKDDESEGEDGGINFS